MKNKNTLLYDFMKIYKKIECDGLTLPCHKCKNKNYVILQKMLLKILEIYTMRVNRNLLNDVEKIYFSIPCTFQVSCEHCKNKLICDTTENLIKSIKKFY